MHNVCVSVQVYHGRTFLQHENVFCCILQFDSVCMRLIARDNEIK